MIWLYFSGTMRRPGKKCGYAKMSLPSEEAVEKVRDMAGFRYKDVDCEYDDGYNVHQ